MGRNLRNAIAVFEMHSLYVRWKYASSTWYETRVLMSLVHDVWGEDWGLWNENLEMSGDDLELWHVNAKHELIVCESGL